MACGIQRLAREEMKSKLLWDIRAGMGVCKLEGWDYREYLIELKGRIEGFL